MNIFEQIQQHEEAATVVRNLAEKRKTAIVCSLIGRGGKFSLVVLDSRNLSKAKVHMVGCVQKGQEFAPTMLNALTAVVNKGVKDNLSLDITTVDNNAVTWRCYRKFAKICGLNRELIAEKMMSSAYFTAPVDENGERKRAQLVAAIKAFVNAMVDADEKGLFVEVKKASEFNKLMLSVPEGVAVSAGDRVTFENGKTESGITVQGWPSFSRKNAEVLARITKDGSTAYYLKMKNKLTPVEAALQNALGKQWAECPELVQSVELGEAAQFTF